MGTQALKYNQNSLNGEIIVPGDKSISHRSVMFGAIAKGVTTVTGFLMGEDCLSTVSCFRQLGVEIEQNDDKLIINGNGLKWFEGTRRSIECWKFGHYDTIINGDFGWS